MLPRKLHRLVQQSPESGLTPRHKKEQTTHTHTHYYVIKYFNK